MIKQLNKTAEIFIRERVYLYMNYPYYERPKWSVWTRLMNT